MRDARLADFVITDVTSGLKIFTEIEPCTFYLLYDIVLPKCVVINNITLTASYSYTSSLGLQNHAEIIFSIIS